MSNPDEYSERLLIGPRKRGKILEPPISQELLDWLDSKFQSPRFTYKDGMRRMDYKHGEQNVIRSLKWLFKRQQDPTYTQG